MHPLAPLAPTAPTAPLQPAASTAVAGEALRLVASGDFPGAAALLRANPGERTAVETALVAGGRSTDAGTLAREFDKVAVVGSAVPTVAGYAGLRPADEGGYSSGGGIRGTSGNDWLEGSNRANWIYGYGGHDVLIGNGGNDRLYGSEGTDKFFGGDGADRIYGGNDNDELYGDAGNDVLVGGRGRDIMWGGAGSDRFVFGAGPRQKNDFIGDFGYGNDRLDVSQIDANPRIDGNQAFRFTGNFDGRPGAMVVTRVTERDGDERTNIAFDIDGDYKADRQITLNGHHQLTARDFVL